MKKRSKRYRKLIELIDQREHSLDEAVELLKKTAAAKFDESVEIAIRLGVDPRRAEQAVRGTVSLPHGLGKEVRVLLRGLAKESFIELKRRNDKESQTLLRSIQRVIDILKNNPQFGDPIKKELIPDSFKKQEIQNLYRVELSNFWRMLYTIKGSRIEIFVFGR